MAIVGEVCHVKNDKAHLTDYGQIVADSLQHLHRFYPTGTVEEYIVMPDHVHAMIYIQSDWQHVYENGDDRQTLSDMMRGFKAYTAREINKLYKPR